MKKYILSLLLALFVLSGTAFAAELPVFKPIAVVADNDFALQTATLPEELVWKDEYTRYGDQLTGEAADFYQALEESFADGTVVLDSVDFQDGAKDCWVSAKGLEKSWTWEEHDGALVQAWFDEMSPIAFLACQAFAFDHPEYFWIRQHYAWDWDYTYDNDTVTYRMLPVYVAQVSCDTQQEIDALQAELDPVIEQLLADTEGLPTVARLAYWDNWLAANNEYNHTAADTDEYITTDDTPWSIVGSLLPGYSPVCEGYAKAFQLLCHRISVPCLQVSGYGHMWNFVKLDGKWYRQDATHNDPTIYGTQDTLEYSSRTWFLTPDTNGYEADKMNFLTPTIETEAYFSGWDATGSAIIGGEMGSGTMMIALYDEKGMQITSGVCTQIYWTGEGNWAQYMYVAPEFSAADLAKAAKIRRFAFGENWIAKTAALTIE